MQRAGREQRGGLAVTAPAARAQVTAGKPVYVLLSGSAYTDNYTVRLGVVPPLAANPALTVRAACRCKAQGRCHDPQCPDSAVVPVTAGARRAATHASRTCGKRPKLRSSAARAAPPLSTHAQARPAACALPAICTCEPRLLPIPSSPASCVGVPRWARPHARVALRQPARAQEVRFDSIQRAAAPAPAGAAAGGAYAGALPAAGGPSAAPGNGANGAWAGGAAGLVGGGFTDSGLLSAGRQEYDCPCAPGSCQGPEVLYTFRAAQQGFVQARRRSVHGPCAVQGSAMRKHALRSGGQKGADARGRRCTAGRPPNRAAASDASCRLSLRRPSARCISEKVASCS